MILCEKYAQLFVQTSNISVVSTSNCTNHAFLQLVCSGSCAGPSDEISPLYSLWATFIGLYIANYVVERSTGYVLMYLLSLESSGGTNLVYRILALH